MDTDADGRVMRDPWMVRHPHRRLVDEASEAVLDKRGSITASFAPASFPSMIRCACGLK